MDELNHSEAQNLLEIIGEGILTTDLNLEIRYFNKALSKLFYLSSADIGRPLKDAIPVMDFDGLKNDIQKVKDHHSKIKKEISTTDGRTFILRLHPHKNSKDEAKSVVFTFTKITTPESTKEQLARRLRQQIILSDLGLYALARNNPQDIIHRSLQIICLVLRIDYSLLLEYNDEKEILDIVDCAALDKNAPKVQDVEMDSKYDTVAAFNREGSLIISDFKKEKENEPVPITGNQKPTSSINVRVEGCDRPYGVLCAYTKEKREFSEYDRCFIQVVANLISEAQERTKKEQALEKEAEQSKKYQRAILHSSVTERWNIGAYLHDTLAQILTSVKIKISHIKRQIKGTDFKLSSEFDSILEKIDEAISGVRDLTHEVIPVDIEEEGIEHAFRLLMRGLQKRHGLNCSLETGKIIEKIKSKDVASNLYHIIQEAVKNAALHGEADNVEVILTEEDNHLKLQIIDDGVGLSKTKPKKGIGSGTNIMKHRIELLGGSFKREEVSEADKTGTCVTLILPVKYLTKSPKEIE